MFSLHDTALLDKLTGSQRSHDFSYGNHDAHCTWQLGTETERWPVHLGYSLPQRIFSLKGTYDHRPCTMFEKTQRTHRKKHREGTSAAYILGSFLVPSPDDSQPHAWSWGPGRPSVLPLIGLSQSLFLLKLVALLSATCSQKQPKILLIPSSQIPTGIWEWPADGTFRSETKNYCKMQSLWHYLYFVWLHYSNRKSYE